MLQAESCQDSQHEIGRQRVPYASFGIGGARQNNEHHSSQAQKKQDSQFIVRGLVAAESNRTAEKRQKKQRNWELHGNESGKEKRSLFHEGQTAKSIRRIRASLHTCTHDVRQTPDVRARQEPPFCYLS